MSGSSTKTRKTINKSAKLRNYAKVYKKVLASPSRSVKEKPKVGGKRLPKEPKDETKRDAKKEEKKKPKRESKKDEEKGTRKREPKKDEEEINVGGSHSNKRLHKEEKKLNAYQQFIKDEGKREKYKNKSPKSRMKAIAEQWSKSKKGRPRKKI